MVLDKLADFIVHLMTYGTQIMSLKKSQTAANIWNFPWA